MLLSLVIVTWESAEHIGACLDALSPSLGTDVEMIVVDNASKDRSSEIVREACPAARVIENSGNLGFAEAANQGIAAARGAWVGTVNPDAVVAPDWVRRMLEAARDAGPDVGMLQSRMLFTDDGRVNSTGIKLTRWGRAGDRDFLANPDASPAGSEVFCPTAGAALYRREMLSAVRLRSGYFDRAYFAYFEDVDLGWRCRLAGWTARYVESASVRHAYQASAKLQKPGFARRQIRRNRVCTLCKNASGAFLLRSLMATIKDLLDALVLGEWSAFRDVALAGWSGLRQRDEVSKLAVVPRSRVEREWAR